MANEHCTRALKVYETFKEHADADPSTTNQSSVFRRAFSALNKSLDFGFAVYQFVGVQCIPLLSCIDPFNVTTGGFDDSTTKLYGTVRAPS